MAANGNLNGEYGMSQGGFVSKQDYQGYMETAPEIKVHSHVSEKNSEKIEESLMNQSNYKVNIDVNDTFGKPKR